MSATRPGPARDPGLQPERTALAWQRTVLAVVLGSLLLAVTAVRTGAVPVAVGAALLAVLAALPTVLRRPDGGLPRDGRLHAWAFLARAVVLVAALGLLGAVGALVRFVAVPGGA